MTTRNRGKESGDDKCFAPRWHPVFTNAVDDCCYFLSRGYAANAILNIVGNHYKLNRRQRDAIFRISCSDQEITARNLTLCPESELKNQNIDLDGFNLLILLESALSGAYVFKGRDGIYRDISGVHGSYKRVLKTENAILLIGHTLKKMGVNSVKWYLDQPVSNSGRLKTRLMEISLSNEFNWDVELVYAPDKILAKSKNIVISSDGWVLDRAKRWFNLGAFLIEHQIKGSNTITV